MTARFYLILQSLSLTLTMHPLEMANSKSYVHFGYNSVLVVLFNSLLRHVLMKNLEEHFEKRGEYYILCFMAYRVISAMD